MLRMIAPVGIVIILCLGLILPAARAGGEMFRAAPLESCDGMGWSGLRFGAMTAQQIKDRYKIDSNNHIPRSLRLSRLDDTGVAINTLFAGKKDTDPLEAFSLLYAPGAMDLGTLQSDLGEDGQARYPRERYQDWWLQVFPDKGVVAFVVNTPGGKDVPQALLLPLGAMASAVHGLPPDPTPVAVLVDPHAGEPRVMSFGTTDATGSIKGLPSMEHMRERIERRMVDGTAGGAMRYVSGAPGSYTAEISGDFNSDKGGKVTVDCKIQGTSPYGEVDATGHADGRIRADDDPMRIIHDVADSAMSDAEANYAKAMSRVGPPTPDQVRADQWDRLFQTARGAAGDTLAN